MGRSKKQSVYAVEGELVLLEMLKMLEQLNVSDEIKTIVKDKLGQFADQAKRFVQKLSRQLNRSAVTNN